MFFVITLITTVFLSFIMNHTTLKNRSIPTASLGFCMGVEYTAKISQMISNTSFRTHLKEKYTKIYLTFQMKD